MHTIPVVELRIDGRPTAATVAGFADPLRACVLAGQPFLALFDRRTLGAPTKEGRAALGAVYGGWDRIASLVVAWADVYDTRRAHSIVRARAAREGAARRAGPPYPYALFDELDAARAWLRGVPSGGPAVPGPRSLVSAGR